MEAEHKNTDLRALDQEARHTALDRAAELRAWLVRGQRRIAGDDETLVAIIEEADERICAYRTALLMSDRTMLEKQQRATLDGSLRVYGEPPDIVADMSDEEIERYGI